MEKEIFLNFKMGNKNVVVERKDNSLTFEALESDGNPFPIQVEESIKCKMYRFQINEEKCILAFDGDDVCLHIQKENGLDCVYYSLEHDDSRMYTIDEVKEIYEEKCVKAIESIKEKFEMLLFDLTNVIGAFKQVKVNKIKHNFYKEINETRSLYMLNMYQSEYIFEVKECNNNALTDIKNLEKKYIEAIRDILNKVN